MTAAEFEPADSYLFTEAQRDALDALEVYRGDKSLPNLAALGEAMGTFKAAAYGPTEADLREIEAGE